MKSNDSEIVKVRNPSELTKVSSNRYKAKQSADITGEALSEVVEAGLDFYDDCKKGRLDDAITNYVKFVVKSGKTGWYLGETIEYSIYSLFDRK
jgi:hypothetical protein